MGLYTKHVLPRLIELTMKNPEMTRLREAWIPKVHGDVLEIGIGSGLNLPFYSSAVRRVYGVDPSTELQRIARQRAEGRLFSVEFLCQSADEPLPLDAASIDSAVLTWTLCSIPNGSRALHEIQRVLRPGGNLLFLEHGRAPDPRVAIWQDRLTPAWKHIGGGCHLNRPIEKMITEAGFRISDLKTCYLPGPRPMTFTYQGVAVSGASPSQSRA